jgi:hypothetical protein
MTAVRNMTVRKIATQRPSAMIPESINASTVS